MTGAELRRWRQDHAWTLEQAGRYLGVTGTSVYRWEQDIHPIPPTIRILASLLHIDKNIRHVEKIMWNSIDI